MQIWHLGNRVSANLEVTVKSHTETLLTDAEKQFKTLMLIVARTYFWRKNHFK